MDEQERLEEKLEKRTRKALRSYRWRPFKNFLWWFTGIISSIIIFAGSIFAGLALIPINTYTGGNNDGVISDELAGSTILNLVMNLDKYGTSDIPIIKQLLIDNIDNGDFGKYVEIDYDKFDALNFTNIGNGIMDCIKVVASLDSLGVSSMLGDLGSLKTLTDFTEVEGTVDTQASNFNAKLYYYDKNQIGGAGNSPMSAIETNGQSFVRAFDDNGNRIAPANAKLYYGAITKISLLDAFDLLDETFSRVEVSELLDMAAGGSSSGEEGLINKILDGKKLSELGSITADDLNLSDVLGGDADDQIYKILSSAVNKEWNKITLSDLTDGLDINGITLSTFLGENAGEEGEIGYILSKALNGKAYAEITVGDLSGSGFNIDGVTLDTFKVSEDVLDIICQAVVVEPGEERPTKTTINVGHLSNINMDTVSLTKFLGEETDDNKEIYNLLRGIANKGEGEDVLVSDLTGDLSFDDIKLDTVLKRKDENDNPINVKIWEILDMAVVDTDADGIEISELGSLDYNKIKLSIVMSGITADSEIAKLIVGATPANSWADATVSHLNNFNANDIKLETVLKKKDENNNPINVKIWDVLEMAVTDIDNDGIEISELANFEYDGILLNKVMPYDNDNTDGKSNSKLYDVLYDVTGKTYDKVSLGHLSNFNTDAIKINTVIPKTNSNKELYNILIDITKETDYTKITLSSLSSFSIENLHLETVLGDSINQTLKSVLCEALGKTTAQFGDVLVGDIGSNNFDIGRVKLSSVMTKSNGSYGNAILDTLLGDTENPVTLSTVGKRISGLSLYDAYGKECFKPIDTNGAEFVDENTWFALEYIDTNNDGKADHYAFVHEDAEYFEKKENENAVKYGLCANDGIWLLLCFEGVDFADQGDKDTDGRPEKYVISDKKLGDLENDASGLSNVFSKATIRQLIDAGIIPVDDCSPELYTFTLLEVVEKLSERI